MRARVLALNPTGKLTLWDVANRVNQILRGRTNNMNDITLTSTSTTTVINDPIITPGSHITVTGLTANAGTALAVYWISGRTGGQATINHASVVDAAMTCTYQVSG